MAPRVLLLVGSTSYRTDAFVAAARRLGARIVLGSDRCHELAQVWPDDAYARLGGYEASLALDYRDLEAGARQIASASGAARFDAIVATDDLTAVLAARASVLLGRAGNDPDAVEAARDKEKARDRLRAAGVPCPPHRVFAEDLDPEAIADAIESDASLGFPCVCKPLLLSASRGVIRANDRGSLRSAIARIRAILRTRAEHADGIDPAARRILVERFVPGVEVALEGILGEWPDGSEGAEAAATPVVIDEQGGERSSARLRTLAIFDKPDPLDGPYFEETIYVTPSRLPPEAQASITRTVQAAGLALGLRRGPIHAEVRFGDGGPQVIEVAARSIGGLCARALRFALGGEADHALEELVLRQALRLDTASMRAVRGAAGVMMLPTPAAGILRGVSGVEDARAVPLIEDVVITVRPGERLVPLPEGSSYPGFLFARGEEPADVEAALRRAHAALRFDVSPALP